MHTPALALAWEFWARNRWGFTAILAGVAIGAVLSHTLPGPAIAEGVVLTSAVVLTFVFVYLLSIFVYTDLSDGARRSGFPARMFALPVRTWKLVALPMCYGMAAVALLWGALGLAGLDPLRRRAGVVAAGVGCHRPGVLPGHLLDAGTVAVPAAHRGGHDPPGRHAPDGRDQRVATVR
jgi:hypothetical protein